MRQKQHRFNRARAPRPGTRGLGHALIWEIIINTETVRLERRMLEVGLCVCERVCVRYRRRKRRLKRR